MSNVEEDYLDVLQNIEFAIVQAAHADRTLIDVDVLDAVDAWSAITGRRRMDGGLRTIVWPKSRPASSRGEDMCEWRLGGGSSAIRMTMPALQSPFRFVACLRRIQKSIRLDKEGGGRVTWISLAIHPIAANRSQWRRPVGLRFGRRIACPTRALLE